MKLIKSCLPILMLAGILGCSQSENSEFVEVDNSGRNVRDKNQDTITPENQRENDSDLTITKKIRQTVVADETLSMNAKNIKIVTMNGVATLRGPVESQLEKDKIGETAREVAGVSNVNNQLDVKN